jgi:hypothetical protein
MSLLELIDEVKAAAEADNGKDQGKHAELLDKIHRLQLAAETPDETVMRLRWQFMTTAATRFALEYGILNALCESDGPITAAVLAQKTGADALLIVRNMRLVPTHPTTGHASSPCLRSPAASTIFTISASRPRR